MSERDIFDDPQFGDIVEKSRLFFEVTKREGSNVKVRVTGSRPAWWGLSEWKQLKGCRVVKAAAKT